MKRARTPRKPKDRGAALVLVLWGAVVMSIIAAAAARQATTAAAVVNAGAELTRARALADGGVRSGWSAFADGRIDDFNALWACQAGEDTLYVRVRPESARIDINQASEIMLASLYSAAGAGEQAAADLAAATIDYRDFGGDVEGSDGQAAAPGRSPEGTFQRGPFQAIEELGYLPGMDASLYRAIEDDITTEGRSADIDVDNASPLVKRAFELAIGRDADAAFRTAPAPRGGPAFEGSLIHVRAIAVTASGGVFVRDGVVEGPFDGESVPKLKRLVQGSLRPDERLPPATAAPACTDSYTAVLRFPA